MKEYDIVTGGAGFIGSHLVEELLNLGRNVIVIDNLCRGSKSNLPDNENLIFIEKDFSKTSIVQELVNYKIDTIYNLATVGLLESLEDPERGFMAEIEIAKSGCTLARYGFCKRLIYFSTSEIYGEGNIHIKPDYVIKRPTTPYAIGKLAGHMLVENYIKLFNINAYIIVPFNNYGPRQTLVKYQGIIPLAIKQMMLNKDIPIYGTGNQVRDYIYVKDTIKWMLRATYFYPMALRVFNISAQNHISVLQLIEKIGKIGGWDVRLIFRDSRPGDEEYLTCDINPLIELTPFDQGLKETVDWYVKYYMPFVERSEL